MTHERHLASRLPDLPRRPSSRAASGGGRRERGTAMPFVFIALVVLVVLGIAGMALLTITGSDQDATLTSNRVRASFYGSEAALEHGREELRQWNIASGTLTLDDELTRAAGPNGILDVDPAALQPIYDASGNVTGFSGAGDDEPLRPLTVYESGAYAAFVSNDPAEGRGTLTDGNRQLTVIGIAETGERSTETVEAVVRHVEGFPQLPAAITILGPAPAFKGGASSAKTLTGNDCGRPYWIPGPSVPVVGVIGPAAEALADSGVLKPDTYREGTSQTGADTVDDIDGTIDARWTDCAYLRELAARVKALAHVVGTSATPNAALGVPGNPKIVFIEGDYDVRGGFAGAGLLWVTGTLYFSGNASWDGPIFAVGVGDFDRYGAGNGAITGGSLVADIAGPDRALFTSDDCSALPDGFEPAMWDVSGSGSGDTVYCSTDIDAMLLRWPFEVEEFRQR